MTVQIKPNGMQLRSSQIQKRMATSALENAEGSKGPTVETTNCEDHIADYINDSIDEALERSSKKKASLRAEDEVEKKAGEINICISINICSTRPRHC